MRQESNPSLKSALRTRRRFQLIGAILLRIRFNLDERGFRFPDNFYQIYILSANPLRREILYPDKESEQVSASGPNITVIGSINMDLLVRCPALPRPGETVLGDSSAEVCGGKGANQAVAAARAGGQVKMIGHVGDDAFATRLVGNLEQEHVDCSLVGKIEGCPSGLAVVAVEESGQNSIIVVPGANGQLSVTDIASRRDIIESSDMVLLQLEVPLETVVAAIKIARAAGVRVLLDPAPAPREWPSELLQVDLICPNESEAAALVGQPVESLEEAEFAARKLFELGAKHVAITLGHRGSMLYDGIESRRFPPFEKTSIDSTAAGDAFAGALAVRWAEIGEPVAAVKFANAAGALAASRLGAQPSLPHRAEIETLWRS